MFLNACEKWMSNNKKIPGMSRFSYPLPYSPLKRYVIWRRSLSLFLIPETEKKTRLSTNQLLFHLFTLITHKIHQIPFASCYWCKNKLLRPFVWKIPKLLKQFPRKPESKKRFSRDFFYAEIKTFKSSTMRLKEMLINFFVICCVQCQQATRSILREKARDCNRRKKFRRIWREKQRVALTGRVCSTTMRDFLGFETLVTAVANFTFAIHRRIWMQRGFLTWVNRNFSVFDCFSICFLIISVETKCSHKYNGTMTQNLKVSSNLSNLTEIKNAAEIVYLDLNFEPSTHIGETFLNLTKLLITDQSIKFIERENFADLMYPKRS